MFEVQIEERLNIEALAAVIMIFESDGIEEYGSLVAALEWVKYKSKPKNLELDMIHSESPPARPSIEEDQKLELKALPPHVGCVFFGRDDTLQVIIASDFNVQQVECLVDVFKRFKWAIGWNIVDIIGIPLAIFSHNI